MFKSALPRIPLINEQSLLDHADSLLSTYQEKDNPQHLSQLINESEDINTKTAICYQYFRNKHQHFIHQLNNQSLQSKQSRCPRHFIIIPALLHEKYPALGGNGHLFVDIGKRFGHKIEILNVNGGLCRQSVVSILSDRIRQCKEKKLCLVGISRGAADIFSYLKIHGNAHIEMVINIAGVIKGTPLSSYIMATKWRRLKYRLAARYCEVDFRSVAELSCENELFRDTEEIAKQIPLINFIGIPLPSHVQAHLLNRYLALAKNGPNDGMLMLKDYFTFSGHTYPIWGGDHFFRLPGYSRILYQLFNFLEEQSFA